MAIQKLTRDEKRLVFVNKLIISLLATPYVQLDDQDSQFFESLNDYREHLIKRNALVHGGGEGV